MTRQTREELCIETAKLVLINYLQEQAKSNDTDAVFEKMSDLSMESIEEVVKGGEDRSKQSHFAGADDTCQFAI